MTKCCRHQRQGGRAALHAEVGVAAVRQADVRPAEGRRVPLHEEVSAGTPLTDWMNKTGTLETQD